MFITLWRKLQYTSVLSLTYECFVFSKVIILIFVRNDYSGILLCAVGFSLGDVESAFKEAKIEPDIIDKAPIEKIEVIYFNYCLSLQIICVTFIGKIWR